MRIASFVILLFFVTAAPGSLIFENHGIIFKFDRTKYDLNKPNNFGTSGILAMIKDKKNEMRNFSLSSGGFVPSIRKFSDECKQVHQAYLKMGGTMSKLKEDLKSAMPKCSFSRNRQGSLDMVEMTYDFKRRRAFIFSGILLKRKDQNVEQYKNEFKQLADGIAFNIEG